MAHFHTSRQTTCRHGCIISSDTRQVGAPFRVLVDSPSREVQLHFTGDTGDICSTLSPSACLTPKAQWLQLMPGLNMVNNSTGTMLSARSNLCTGLQLAAGLTHQCHSRRRQNGNYKIWHTILSHHLWASEEYGRYVFSGSSLQCPSCALSVAKRLSSLKCSVGVAQTFDRGPPTSGEDCNACRLVPQLRCS